LIRINSDATGKQVTICQYICKFLPHAIWFRVLTPLEALEQFTCLDECALRKILLSVEQVLISFSSKSHECVTDRPYGHEL
jgi:hypothetical protein